MKGIQVATRFYPERLPTLHPPVIETLGFGGYRQND